MIEAFLLFSILHLIMLLFAKVILNLPHYQLPFLQNEPFPFINIKDSASIIGYDDVKPKIVFENWVVALIFKRVIVFCCQNF